MYSSKKNERKIHAEKGRTGKSLLFFFFYPIRFLPARENASMRVSVGKKTVVNVFETQGEKKNKHTDGRKKKKEGERKDEGSKRPRAGLL